MSRATTTSAIEVPPSDRVVKPEWLRVDECPKVFGISRRTVYNLIGDRRVESVCLRLRGQMRGIRLVNFDSLESCVKGSGSTKNSPVPRKTSAKKSKD